MKRVAIVYVIVLGTIAGCSGSTMSCPVPDGGATMPMSQAALPAGACTANGASSCDYTTWTSCSGGGEGPPVLGWSCVCLNAVWRCEITSQGLSLGCKSTGASADAGANTSDADIGRGG
jgi:hypothetical protein